MTMRFAWTSFRRSLLPEHRTFLIVFALLAALAMVGGSMLAATSAESYAGLSKESALTLIEVNSSAPGGTKPVTGAAVSSFEGLPGVQSFHEWAQAGLLTGDGITQDGVTPVVLWATAAVPTLQGPFQGPHGKIDNIECGTIVAPRKVGSLDLTPFVGQRERFTFQRKTGGAGQMDAVPVDVTIVSFHDGTTNGLDGQEAAYACPDQVLSWAAAANGQTTSQLRDTRIDKVFVRVRSVDDVEPVLKRITDDGYAAGSMYRALGQLPQALQLLRVFALALGAFMALGCAVVGSSIGASYATTRRRIVGLLRALGWSRGRVFAVSLTELVILGLCAGVLAVALAAVAAGVLSRLVGTFDVASTQVSLALAPPIAWQLGSVLLPPLFLASGAAPRLWRGIRVPPDEALREL